MTAINEGIYRIKSVATGQLLTYNSEGGDEYAKLRVWYYGYPLQRQYQG